MSATKVTVVVDDRATDDLALWIRPKLGLVVIVGCSHAGRVDGTHFRERR